MSQNGSEKELILGNKQLISLFFVVVALCGVFFAMGYMVRGNALKGKLSTPDDDASAASSTAVRRQQPEPPRETVDTQPVDPNPQTAQQSPEPAPETHPAQEAGTNPPVSYDPQPFQKSDPKPDGPKSEGLEAGATYVQVGALGRADAESTVRTLREQHLPASLTASPKEGLFRVLVGPYHQTTDVADAKAKLKTLGFSNTIVQKQ